MEPFPPGASTVARLTWGFTRVFSELEGSESWGTTLTSDHRDPNHTQKQAYTWHRYSTPPTGPLVWTRNRRPLESPSPRETLALDLTLPGRATGPRAVEPETGSG